MTNTKTQFVVKYTKEFTSGNLKGIFLDVASSCISLEQANELINFLHAHKNVPVESMDSSNYICHMARITLDSIYPNSETNNSLKGI